MKIFLFITGLFVLFVCNTKQGKAEQTSTIDSILQTRVISILESKLDEFDAQAGQVVIMDVKSGNVLATVGYGLNVQHRSSLVRVANLY